MNYAAEYGHFETLEEHPSIRSKIDTVKIGMTASNSCYSMPVSVVEAISAMPEREKLSILQSICSHPNGHTLLDHGCDTILSKELLSKACSLDGFTPLMIAVKFQRKKCVEHLLKESFCSQPMLEIASTDLKRTVLHICAEYPDESITEMLLKTADRYGLDIEPSDIFGNTPLHIYAKRNNENTPMCKKFISHLNKKAQLLERIPGYLEKRNNDGFTPFHLATENEHNEMVKHMLDRVSKFKPESSLIEYCDQQLRTSLHIAALNGI